MANNNKTGLGSDTMDSDTKYEIQSEGGKAAQEDSEQGVKGGQSSRDFTTMEEQDPTRQTSEDNMNQEEQ
jgi:hypothetical protein